MVPIFCDLKIAKISGCIMKNKVLSRHNNTQESVSQDLAIGRLIPGSNPGTLFFFCQ